MIGIFAGFVLELFATLEDRENLQHRKKPTNIFFLYETIYENFCLSPLERILSAPLEEREEGGERPQVDDARADVPVPPSVCSRAARRRNKLGANGRAGDIRSRRR